MVLFMILTIRGIGLDGSRELRPVKGDPNPTANETPRPRRRATLPLREAVSGA